MKLDERTLMQFFAELKTAQQQGIAIFTQALCQQVDPGRLKADLQKSIAAAKQSQGISSLAIDIATHAMAAADAEQMLQAKTPSEGPYPKREG
jgi:hypothetical protein